MTDREADEYELALHRKSALRGWAIGGALLALGTVVFLATGWAFIGVLFIPGALMLGNAWTHHQKANAIAARLALPAMTYAPSAPAALGRGARVVVTWSDGRPYPGFVLELRGHHVLVQFEGGRQDWVPIGQVRPP